MVLDFLVVPAGPVALGFLVGLGYLMFHCCLEVLKGLEVPAVLLSLEVLSVPVDPEDLVGPAFH